MASSLFFCTPPAYNAAKVWRGACACSDVQAAHAFARERGYDFGDLLHVSDLLKVFDDTSVKLKQLEIVTGMCEATRFSASKGPEQAKDYLAWMALLDIHVAECRAMQKRIATAIRNTTRHKA